MPVTATHDLPYPALTDDVLPASVDIKDLAIKVAAELDNIAPSQIAGVPAGRLLIANGSGVVTGAAVSGDGTIDANGVFEIGPKKVGTTELDDKAATTAKLDDLAVVEGKIANNAVSSDKANLSHAEDVLGSNSAMNLASSGEEVLFGGNTRAGGISLVIATARVLLDGPSGSNLMLYLNIFSGQQVRYVISSFKHNGAPGGGCETVMTLCCLTPASSPWAPNISMDTGSGVGQLLAGSRISSVRIS